MPELPEVETIKKGLTEKIVGKTITDLNFDVAKSFQGKKEDIIGSRVTDIERRAKLIRVKLSNDLNLLFHLKLTGQLIYIENQKRFAGGHPSHDWHAKLPNSNTRMTLAFDDKSKLFFNDMRKFGWCKVLTDQEVDEIFGGYGIEPFTEKFTTEYLMLKAKKIPNRKIKQFLTDQEIIAGIGNIYADEALFESKISPERRLKDISLSEYKKLTEAILLVLKKGIEYGGTTDSDYVKSDGTKGGMQDHLKVYHRTGKPCLGCKGVVKRMTLGGRGTHFCPSCQK